MRKELRRSHSLKDAIKTTEVKCSFKNVEMYELLLENGASLTQ